MTQTPGPGASLHVIYRSHGAENDKSRPAYYSKLSSLVSVVRAVEATSGRAEVVFLNDGPIPRARLDVMAAAGEVYPIEGGSNRKSYRAALSLGASRWNGREDLVWFAEDDYLYQPATLNHLLDAIDGLSDGDYFGLYGQTALDVASPRRRPARRPQPVAGDPAVIKVIDGLRWHRIMSTTSTFGVRGSVLRADLRLLRAAPFTGGAFDHTSGLTAQGLTPFTGPELRADLLPIGMPLGQWPRALSRGVMRAGWNLRARRRPQNRRLMYGAAPEPVTHMEDDKLAPGTDWAAVAADTLTWAAARGIVIAPLSPVPEDPRQGRGVGPT